MATEREDLIPRAGAIRSGWLRAGALGCAVFMILGIALAIGWVQVPDHDQVVTLRSISELGSRPLMWLVGIAELPTFLAVPGTIATVLLWLAFLRPQLPDRILFAAATIVGSLIVVANISGLCTFLAEHGLRTMGLIAYPNYEVAIASSCYAALFASARELPPRWRRTVEGLCVTVIFLVVVGQLAGRISPILVAGGLAVGIACFSFAVAAAQSVGVDLFPIERA